MKTRTKLSVCLAALAATFAAPCFAASPRENIAQGNAHYSKGEYDQALQAYEKASTALGGSAVPLFNKGAALFRKGEYDGARQAFEEAALAADDPSLEAKAHYNLGNTAFNKSRSLLADDPSGSLALLEQSARHYRQALRLDPRLEDAAVNMEIARVRMKELQERMDQLEQQAAERQQRREEAARKLEEAVESQKRAGEQNREARRKADEQAEAPSGEDLEKLREQQEKAREQTRQAAEELREAQPESDAGEKLSRAGASQKEALDHLGRGELEQAASRQEEALEEMSQALEGLREKEKADSSSRGSPDSPPRTAKDEPAAPPRHPEKTPSSADEGSAGEESEQALARFGETAEDVIMEEKENRLKRWRGDPAKVGEVEKDW